MLTCICLCIAILFFVHAKIEPTRTYEVELSKCVDGDTAWFVCEEETFKARFLAIDAPELETDALADEAKEFTCQLLRDAQVILLEEDPKADTTDAYDRRLVWVWIDGELLQERLIEEGYAKVAYIYDEYVYVDALRKMEQKAKEANKGIWKGIFE